MNVPFKTELSNLKEPPTSIAKLTSTHLNILKIKNLEYFFMNLISKFENLFNYFLYSFIIFNKFLFLFTVSFN